MIAQPFTAGTRLHRGYSADHGLNPGTTDRQIDFGTLINTDDRTNPGVFDFGTLINTDATDLGVYDFRFQICDVS